MKDKPHEELTRVEILENYRADHDRVMGSYLDSEFGDLEVPQPKLSEFVECDRLNRQTWSAASRNALAASMTAQEKYSQPGFGFYAIVVTVIVALGWVLIR